MMNKILIIQGNPVSPSYNGAIAEAYRKGAVQAGAEVRMITLNELEFNMNLEGGYRNKLPLEPDLLEAQEAIKWAEHLVWVFPIWWGGPPALLKGFVDRIFMPGYAFKYQKGKPFPDQLLKGRTARMITTMDGPSWYFKWFQGEPAHKMMKISTFAITGIKPVRITTVDQVGKKSDEQRKNWLDKIELLGRKMG
ncbi:NAD(P)H-dependent oxidoreductase [Priestia sp. FSL H7-0729]